MANGGIFDRKTKLGWKFARKLVLGRGHQPSNFNRCVGSKLRDVKYATPAKGMGGMRNEKIQNAFVQAAIACGAHVGEKAKVRFAEGAPQRRVEIVNG